MIIAIVATVLFFVVWFFFGPQCLPCLNVHQRSLRVSPEVMEWVSLTVHLSQP